LRDVEGGVICTAFPETAHEPLIMFAARIDNNRRRSIVREIADATVIGSRAGARGRGGH